MPRRLKPLILNLALLGFAVAFSVGAAEVVLRLFPGLMQEEAQLRIHWRGLQESEAVTRPHPYIGFLYPPNHKGEMRRGRSFGFSYTTDGNGFRNPWPWPDQAEIVAVGDSMVFGYGVEDDQGWVKLLADALPVSRVINLGMIGAAPQQYARIYETFGVALRPKVVLFALFPGNDLYDAETFDRWEKAGAPGNFDVWRLTGGRRPETPSVKGYLRRLVEDSYLATTIREARRAAASAFTSRTLDLADGGTLRLAPSLYTDDAERALPGQPAFGLVMAAIERGRALAQAGAAAFVVLLVPTKEEVYLPVLGDPAPQMVAPIAAALAGRGIPYLDLTPFFQVRARAGETVYFEVDGHPNVAGYRMMADAVLEYLKANAERYGLRDWQ